MYARQKKKKKGPIVIPLIRSANLRLRNQAAGHTSGPRELRVKGRPACGDPGPWALACTAYRVSFMAVLGSPW